MKIKIDGIGRVSAALGKVGKNVEKQVDDLLQGAALRTVGLAKMRLQPLPGDDRKTAADIGAVRQSINSSFDRATKTATVSAGNVQGDHLAAYLDFGTGKYAARETSTLPAWAQKLAMQFYVNGEGRMRAHSFFVRTFIQEGERLKDKFKGLKVGW